MKDQLCSHLTGSAKSFSEIETYKILESLLDYPLPLRPFKVPSLCKNSSMQEEGKKAVDSFDTIEGWPLPTVETEANGDF